jgi:hypothetical protein
MSCAIHRAHAEYYIILRNLQGCTVRTRYHLGVLPFRTAGRAPDYFVARGAGRRFPSQMSIIPEFFGSTARTGRRADQGSQCGRFNLRYVTTYQGLANFGRSLLDAVLGPARSGAGGL